MSSLFVKHKKRKNNNELRSPPTISQSKRRSIPSTRSILELDDLYEISHISQLSPFTNINDEKNELLENRLQILNDQLLNLNIRKLDKLLVVVSLEYILNSIPKNIVLNNMYNTIQQSDSLMIDTNHLIEYIKHNKSYLITFIQLNDIDDDIQLSNSSKWKLNQILSLYKSNKIIKEELKTLKVKFNKLKKHSNDNISHHSKKLSNTSISRRSTKSHSHSHSKSRSKPKLILPTKLKSKKPLIKSQSHEIHAFDQFDALSTWKQYNNRIIYIQQRYTTSFVNRTVAWKHWSKLLNDIELNGQFNIKNIWTYIDFARMSLGRYKNYIWYYKNNIKWKKKYVILMDFHLFLFDYDKMIKDSNNGPRNIKQALSYKHSLISISSFKDVQIIKSNYFQFKLHLNKNKYILFKCKDNESRIAWIEELIYSMKICQDLLKIPYIKLKPGNPSKTIFLPIPDVNIIDDA